MFSKKVSSSTLDVSTYSAASSRTYLQPYDDEKTLHSRSSSTTALTAHNEAEATTISDEDWEADSRNPKNWPKGRKWGTVGIVSFYTFVSPLASSMMAPGLPEIARKFGIMSETVVALTLSIFLLGFAIGPLFCGPLSEMYGRTWVLHICNIFSLGFSIGCAFAPNTASLIVFRLLAGLSGSAPIAIGGGSISDMFIPAERASAMALFSLGPLFGPVIGPISGGFITQSIGVKSVFLNIAGLCGLAALIGIPFLKETYGPVVRARLSPRSTDAEFGIKGDASSQMTNKSSYLWVNLTRPFALLFGSLICFMLSLYQAFLYGIFNLMFTTFSSFFAETYGFNAGTSGLTYLGLGVGFFLAVFPGVPFANKVYQRLAAKNGGVGKPEMRIPALFVGSFFIPVGIFWYGWSAQAKLHWIMPIIGSGIFALGMMTTFLYINLYLVDTFEYAASAMAAGALFRSLLGFAFPLFGSELFDKLGLGPGNSLLAGLAIVLGTPFPVFIYYKGEAMRARNPLSAKSVTQTAGPSQPK